MEKTPRISHACLAVLIASLLIMGMIRISFGTVHYYPPYGGGMIGSNCAASGTAIIRWDEKDFSTSQGLWHFGHAWEGLPVAGAAACHTYGRMEAAEITADCDGFTITANFLLNGRSVGIAAGLIDGVGHAEWSIRVYINVFDENTYEETNSAGYIWSGSVTNPLPIPNKDEHVFENETASNSLAMTTTVGHTYLISGAIDATTSGYAGLAGFSGGENNFWNYTESSSIKLTSLSVSKIYNLVISTTSGGTTNPAPGTYGYNEGEIVSVQAVPYSGYSFSYWVLDETTYTPNPISVPMNSHHTLSAHFRYNGGGGGGCPYVYTWDGLRYIMDNNLLPASEVSSGADVEDYYRLEQPLFPIYQGTSFSLYSLQIREFEHEHDYFDQVSLLAVDHKSDVNIAVAPAGEILTYKDPNPPVSCFDNNGTDRLDEILQMDGNVSDPTTYFYGEAGDYLILNFGEVNAENAKLILRDDMKSMIICIHVQILDDDCEWQTIDTVTPRDYWAIEALSLTEYIPQNSDFMIRLFWTSPHRLDYVGLDTTPQDSFTVRSAPSILAFHSTEGNIRWKLLASDNIYAELTPGQHITLTFILPNNHNEERTFILYTEGHYNTM